MPSPHPAKEDNLLKLKNHLRRWAISEIKDIVPF